MSRDYPDLVNPWKAADGHRSFHGTMQISRMERLTSVLEEPSGEAGFSIRFGYDQQRNVIIDITVDAKLSLLCQRSLQPYLEPVRRKSRLVVIADLEEQDQLPSDADPVLVEDNRLTLLALVEDELLLGVPQVPRNPEVKHVEISTDGVTRAPSKGSDEPLQRPFAGLADLLKTKSQD